jgi:hypothetical protein
MNDNELKLLTSIDNTLIKIANKIGAELIEDPKVEEESSTEKTTELLLEETL